MLIGVNYSARHVAERSALVTLLLISACTTLPPKATEQEVKDVFFAYFSCLHAAARKMDDCKSDASTIGLAIKSMCASEFAQTVETEARGLNLPTRRMFESRVQNSQLEMATKAVLDERINRR